MPGNVSLDSVIDGACCYELHNLRKELLTCLILWLDMRFVTMRIIRLKDVMDSTGLARSTIYKYIGEGLFPRPVGLGDRCVGWLEAEVQEWILARIEERDKLHGVFS